MIIKYSIWTSGGTKQIKKKGTVLTWNDFFKLHRNDQRSWSSLANIQWPCVFSSYCLIQSVQWGVPALTNQLSVGGVTSHCDLCHLVSRGANSFSHCWRKAVLCHCGPSEGFLVTFKSYKEKSFYIFITTLTGTSTHWTLIHSWEKIRYTLIDKYMKQIKIILFHLDYSCKKWSAGSCNLF